MELRFLHALRRLFDATAFENVGHLRDFEALLDRSGVPRDVPDEEAKAAAKRERAAQADDASLPS
jgi:hypothetical protein